MCAGALQQARVRRVVFGAAEPKFGALGGVVDISALTGFNHRFEVTRGVLAAAAEALMKGFFRELRERKD